MAYDASTKTVVLFSGIRGDGTPPLGDTWTWDGCRWTQASPATSPPGRSFGALAFDPSSRKLILFGGGSANSDPSRNDTWSWDGSTWTKEHPATTPPTLDGALIAADAGNRNVVLFGLDIHDNQPATWSWDGSNWLKHQSPTPPVRGNAGMAFGARSGVLLFGGQPGEAGGLNDTWVWDGRTWSQLHPSTTPQGGAVVMAHEDARQDVLLLDGSATWTWTGSNWSPQHPPSTPPFQLFRSIAYDVARDRVVLFGGKAPSNQPTDDTWTWDGVAWRRVGP